MEVTISMYCERLQATLTNDVSIQMKPTMLSRIVLGDVVSYLVGQASGHSGEALGMVENVARIQEHAHLVV